VYGDPEKLEKRYQENVRLRDNPMNKNDLYDIPSKGTKNTLNGYSNPNEDMFRKQYDQSTKYREDEMQNEINKIKHEKAEIRLKKQKEEESLADLMKEIELKKERDLRARIEKEQIKKELVNLEKTKLSSLEHDKKAHLEKLAAEREILKQKEDHLMNEIGKLENEKKSLDQIRRDDMERVDKNAEILKQKSKENKSINELLMNEKSDRVAELKMRRE
jgi:hypothetical protein